ncbi:MAG: phosphotransferase, partial [Bauldia sp.]
EAGLSTPEVYAADTASGLLLLEDFGHAGVVIDGEPVEGRYRVAIEALAHLHGTPRPDELRVDGKAAHRLLHLTGDALLAEIGVFADFYAPHVRGAPLPSEARAELIAIWRELDRHLARHERSWVLFDVQSPNLFWLPEREGVARIGFIDFQDMFVGPSAYDVASLCQDARVTIPADMEDRLADHYVRLRRAADPAFDTDSFRAAYAVTAALRTAKNMGAFSRLAAIGNTSYLSHLRRLRAYLARAVSHPVLSPFALWYEKHLPPL